MPEGDTVWLTARRLDAAFRGVPLTRCDLRFPSVATVDLSGRTTLEVVSRGKHLLHRVEGDVTLHSHLRMEGSWRVYAAGAHPSLQRHTVRAVLGTAVSVAVGTKLGLLDVVPTGREDRLVGHLGPDVLGADWDLGRVLDTLAADDRPLAEALLDQRVLAGLGTFWVSEVLFVHRVQPWTIAREVDREVLATSLADVQRLMRRAVDTGVQTSTGSTRPDQLAFVHARAGLTCRRCGRPLRVALTGPPTRERTIFYCAECQHGLAPTDDGRPARRMAPRGRRVR